VTKKANKAEGAICKELDNVLQELRIHRQQYHGGSFIGNHIHKMLQVTLYKLQYDFSVVTYRDNGDICFSQEKYSTSIYTSQLNYGSITRL